MSKILNTATCRPVIRTRFIGATDHYGPRIVASCKTASSGSQRRYTAWNAAVGSTDNHNAAALKLAAYLREALGFSEPLVRADGGSDCYLYTYLTTD
jgi:hypothetical protein